MFDDRIHADVFGFGPLSERQPGLCANVENLRVGQLHASLAGLHDLHLFAVNVVQSEKDDFGKVALARDSSVIASRRSMGRRSVMPGRSSVHRCPSRFTFRSTFLIGFLAAFTAMYSPPRILLGTLLLFKIQPDLV